MPTYADSRSQTNSTDVNPRQPLRRTARPAVPHPTHSPKPSAPTTSAPTPSHPAQPGAPTILNVRKDTLADAARTVDAERAAHAAPTADAEPTADFEPVAEGEPEADSAGVEPTSPVDAAGEAPADTRRPVRNRLAMFSSLRERNYRLFASGQIVSQIGTWMQRVAQDWLVLTLSHGNPIALGVAAALQFLPTVLLSLWAGVLADRIDKRKLLIVVQAGMGLSGLILGVLDVTGLVQLWQVYALCLILGVFSAFDPPVRQAFVSEMVGRKQVTQAVALNSMSFNMARIVGPAIAGVLITWTGTGIVFLLNAASFVGVLAGLFMMNPAKLHRGDPVPRERGQLVAGLRYVLARPALVVVMTLVFMVSTFGLNFYATLAIAARNVFHHDATGYGLLSTMIAVGTFGGALLAARRSTRGGKPRLRLLIVGGLAFGALEALLGAMPSYTSFAIALVPVGIAMMTFATTANSFIQLTVDPVMRGRVMGLYTLVFLGGNPIGGPLSGWLAAEFGGRAPLVVGGVVSLLAAVVTAGVLAWRNRRVADAV